MLYTHLARGRVAGIVARFRHADQATGDALLQKVQQITLAPDSLGNLLGMLFPLSKNEERKREKKREIMKGF